MPLYLVVALVHTWGMKKLHVGLSVMAVLFLITLSGVSSASAQVANLFANPSVETAASASMPQSWATDVWGTTKATFTYPTGGAQDGTRYVKTQVTTKGTGDAKWYPVHIPATAGQTYTFSEYYQSTVATAVTVEVLLTTGKYTYVDLGAPAASATWKQFQAKFTAPANTKTLTVFHYIQAVGTLSVDNYSLTSGSVTAPFVYALSNAGNRTVMQGASTSTTITATLSSGTTQPVAFSTTGLPSGVTASYSQTSCSPTCSTTLTLTASASAATGTVPVTVTGTSGTTTRSTSFNLTVAAPVVPPTGNNIIPNPSLEDPASDPNATAPTSWFTEGWGTNKTTYTYLKTGGHTGSRAVKVQMTSYTDGDAKWTYNPITVTPGDTYTFSDWYQSATTTHVVIEFTLTDNTQYYIEMRTATTTAANEWKKYQQDFVIPFNAKSVRVFHMIEAVGSLVTDDYSLVKTIPVGFARPIVTLTFDNGFEDNITTVIPLLDQFGYKVTYCFSTEYVEGVPSAMTTTQTIANHGHEVCSHSVHHDQGDLVTLTPTQLDYELGHSQAYLQQLTGQPVRNYISPFGSYNDFSLQFVKKYYRSHRTTDEGYNSKENFDQYRIIVQNMENTTTMAQYKSWVDEAIKDKAWLMLVYHRVASDPTLYDTPLADFQPQLQYLKDKGIAVETTDQALDELIPQVTP